MRPMGTDTAMAMRVISKVPANMGTAPKLPDWPTCSARIAICGLHSRPNRNSLGGTSWKKRIASNKSDRTIPTVVKIASVELTISEQGTNSISVSDIGLIEAELIVGVQTREPRLLQVDVVIVVEVVDAVNGVATPEQALGHGRADESRGAGN